MFWCCDLGLCQIRIEIGQNCPNKNREIFKYWAQGFQVMGIFRGPVSVHGWQLELIWEGRTCGSDNAYPFGKLKLLFKNGTIRIVKSVAVLPNNPLSMLVTVKYFPSTNQFQKFSRLPCVSSQSSPSPALCYRRFWHFLWLIRLSKGNISSHLIFFNVLIIISDLTARDNLYAFFSRDTELLEVRGNHKNSKKYLPPPAPTITFRKDNNRYYPRAHLDRLNLQLENDKRKAFEDW